MSSTWAVSRIPFSPNQIQEFESSLEPKVVVTADRADMGVESRQRISRVYLGSLLSVRSAMKWQGGVPFGDSEHGQDPLELMSLTCREKILASPGPSMIVPE